MSDDAEDAGVLQIAHLFADFGTEAEPLSTFGDVHRFSIAPRPNPYDVDVVEMDLTETMPEERFDLAFLHPPCTRWSDMPDVDPEDHPDLIDRAREIGQAIADHYVIENKPKAPLRSPTILEGRMFGLPIKYERAFEASFDVPQPPRNARLSQSAETSPFFYSERSPQWWASVKGLRGDYPKEHVAKNALPTHYVDHIGRAWLKAINEAQGVADYQDYDAQMDARRAAEANQTLEGFADAE